MADLIKTLAEVKTWLNAQTPGDDLTVEKSLFDAALVGQYFTLISDAQVVLSNIMIVTGETGTASVPGKASFLGYEGGQITVACSES
jgi:hypothetical protein